MSECPGEDFLKEQGLIQRASPQRQKLLGCLGCRWARAEGNNKPPAAYGYEIVKCSGIKSGVIYPLLQKLEDAGVVTSEWEGIKPRVEGRPPRRLFLPINNDLGNAFAASLDQPPTCGLED